MSILPPTDARLFKMRWLRILFGLLLIAGLLGLVVWEKLFHAYPQQLSDSEQFKYGSIGGEEEGGVPYWIWVVLPRVFPEHLPGPGGYASLGMLWEPGYELPVGFSKKRIGYERVAFNCAVCHTGSYRTLRADGRLSLTQITEGGPAIRFDAQAYLSFLARCANDPRFNADTLMSAIEYNTKMSWSDKLLYRHLLIPATKKALLEQSAAAAWMRGKPIWGPGRIDPFNPVKFGMLGMQPDATVGNSDMVPLWGLGKTDRELYHADGLSQDLLDCSLAGALGDGATRKSLPVAHIQKIVASMKDMAPPTTAEWSPAHSAVGSTVNSTLLPEGRVIFQEKCAICHAASGKLIYRSIKHADYTSPTTVEKYNADDGGTIATDPNRLHMWNAPDGNGRMPFEIYNDFGNGYKWDLNTFTKTDGYLALPLNGIRFRAPYLHNGSVPTLFDLLNPPMSVQAVHNLLEEAQPGSFERLIAQLSKADRPQFSRAQIISSLEPLKLPVDRLIQGARLLKLRPPMFYRGSDVLDMQHVGFEHTSASLQPGSIAVPFMTFILGNSNAGHLYGTDLEDHKKQALLEYLKTL
ncbi:MAG: cytochrome c [Pirellulaceae bacterium]|nr:cytochrome c [Pirellulaceae bacterium]